MKFFRYKQVCRLNFFGIDDECNDIASSYYNTKFKLFNNTEINTKLLRFRIENLRDIKLSQNAKLILESVYIPCVINNDLDIKHNSNIILRLKNISDTKCFDSSNDNSNSPILFSHSVQARCQTVVDTDTTVLAVNTTTYNNNIFNTIKYDNGISFFNPSPDKLYNFTIPNTFTNNSIFEFEIIYDMPVGVNIVQADDRGEFYKFQCSLIICDEDEEDLISNDSNTVNYDKFKPHFPLKKPNQ
jgi:hypothetical protein